MSRERKGERRKGKKERRKERKKPGVVKNWGAAKKNQWGQS
jgi:hypothetical protein